MGSLPLGLGIAFKSWKIGDAGRGRNAVAIELLRQFGLLDDEARVHLASVDSPGRSRIIAA